MSRSIIAALALGALLLITGCSSLQSAGQKGYVSGDGTVRIVDAADRDDAISLKGEDLDGKPLDLADLHGEPVVVSVWGAWCTECNAEAPELVAAHRKLGDAAQFVGINVRDGSTAQAKAFVRSFGIDYRSFYSPDGKALLQFRGTLSPNSIPSTVVLDADGRVAATILGTIPSTRTLVDVVHDVAEEQSGSSPDEKTVDG
jgi:thiol-disulfide isomerase/thioredoxin